VRRSRQPICRVVISSIRAHAGTSR
jgi:hypothetical protein